MARRSPPAYAAVKRGEVFMKSMVLAAAGALLPLAACNNSPQVHEENASVAEVQRELARAGASDQFVRAGRWQSKVTIEEMAIPGMPPEMKDRMQAMFAERQPDGFETCLTEEDVKRPKEDFFAGQNKNCRYDHFTMGGGKIDAKMRCSEDRATQVMTMKGDYTPDAYNMQMSMTAQGGGEANPGMSMRMRVNAKRVGQCTGKEDA
jgi:hypothetical protein